MKGADSDIHRRGTSSSKRRVSAGKRKADESDASDVEAASEAQSKRNKRARATPDSEEEEEEEVRPRRTGQEPSDAVLATWRRGDDDMEPSTKMAAFMNYLKEWDASGDKTICYSQCTLSGSL